MRGSFLKKESRRLSVYILLFSTYSNTVISIFNGIILVPLYFKFFDSEVYGAWLASAGVITMLSFFEGGISQVTTQQLAKTYAQKANTKFNLIFSNSLSLIIVICLFIILLGSVSTLFLPQLINAPLNVYRPLKIAIFIASCSTAFNILQTHIFSVFYAWQKTFKVALSSVTTAVLAIIVIPLLLKWDFGVISLSISFLLRSFIVTIFAILFTRKEWKARKLGRLNFNKRYSRIIVKLSLPVFFNKMVNTIANNIEPVVISSFISPQSVVVYNITKKSISLAGGFINPIAGNLLGSLSNLIGAKQKDKTKIIVQELIQLVSLIAIVVVGFLLVINQSFIFNWVGNEYYGGHILSILIATSIIVQTRFNLMDTMLASFGRFNYISFNGLILALARVLLLLILIGFLGLNALPIVLIIIYSVYALIIYPGKLGKFVDSSFYMLGIKEYLLGGLCISVSLRIIPENMPILKLTLYAICIFLGFVMVFFTFSEYSRKLFFGMIKKISKTSR